MYISKWIFGITFAFSVILSVIYVNVNDKEKVEQPNNNNNKQIEKQIEVTPKKIEKPPYKPQAGEIFIGHSYTNGRDCYLIESSIHQNEDRSVDCKLKMTKSADDIEYLEYRFRGNGTRDFSTND